ncbi:OprD family porin, partial [Pseudomonas aeruginosa]
KLRVSHSTLKIGSLMPRLPVVQFNDTRLHPQTFQGGLLEVNEIDGLALQFGQLRQVKQRDSTNAEDLGITRGSKRNVLAGRHPGSDRFDFAGGTYRWSERLSSSYHYANLEDFYRQHYLGVQHLLPLTDDQSLKSDIRWARSTDEGGSRVDNRALNALFTYRLGGHAFGLGYQRMSGDSGFAYLAGTDPYLVNFVQIGDFANKDERSWQLRYDYDFAAIGLPGLTFMSRYLRGEHIDLLDGGGRGKEWERDTDIAYLVQSGPLKNLGIKLRNGTFRSDFGNDIDETRLIVSYALPLW